VKTRIVSGEDGIREAAAILRAGGLAALPTETVYGLGADARNPAACAAIFEAKARPLSDPLIVHVPDRDWFEKLAVPDDLAMELARAFWPGPLTIVVRRRPEVPDIVTAGQETVAVRMSAHSVMAAVLAALGGPVAAPSANRFGRVSPTTPAHVLDELGGRIPLVLDGGPCSNGIESTIVAVHDGSLSILRPGPVAASELARFARVTNPDPGLRAPGRMASHYAPSTPVFLGGCDLPRGRCGQLAWSRAGEGYAACEVLAPDGNPATAAAGLYAALRRLDGLGLAAIIAEPPPPGELASAIADRLRKAAAAAAN